MGRPSVFLLSWLHSIPGYIKALGFLITERFFVFICRLLTCKGQLEERSLASGDSVSCIVWYLLTCIRNGRTIAGSDSPGTVGSVFGLFLIKPRTFVGNRNVIGYYTEVMYFSWALVGLLTARIAQKKNCSVQKEEHFSCLQKALHFVCDPMFWSALWM